MVYPMRQKVINDIASWIALRYNYVHSTQPWDAAPLMRSRRNSWA